MLFAFALDKIPNNQIKLNVFPSEKHIWSWNYVEMFTTNFVRPEVAWFDLVRRMDLPHLGLYKICRIRKISLVYHFQTIEFRGSKTEGTEARK